MRWLACSVAVALAAVLSPARLEAQAVAPAAPVRSSSYFGTMMLADVAVIGVTLGTVGWAQRGGGGSVGIGAGIGALGLVAFVATGAVVHHVYGNDRQVWWSVARRVLLPGGTALGAGLIANAKECSGEDCGLATLAYSALGFGGGMLVALVWDWSVAHLDSRLATSVMPITILDGERVAFGFGARF